MKDLLKQAYLKLQEVPDADALCERIRIELGLDQWPTLPQHKLDKIQNLIDDEVECIKILQEDRQAVGEYITYKDAKRWLKEIKSQI